MPKDAEPLVRIFDHFGSSSLQFHKWQLPAVLTDLDLGELKEIINLKEFWGNYYKARGKKFHLESRFSEYVHCRILYIFSSI